LVARFDIKERTVSAIWSYADLDGTSTFVAVFAFDQSSTPNSLTQGTPFAGIFVTRLDGGGNPLFNGFGSTDEFNLKVGRNLESGRLVMSLPVEDLSSPGVFETFNVDVTFAADNPVVRSHVSDHSHEGGVIVNAHFDGRFTIALQPGLFLASAPTSRQSRAAASLAEARAAR